MYLFTFSLGFQLCLLCHILGNENSETRVHGHKFSKNSKLSYQSGPSHDNNHHKLANGETLVFENNQEDVNDAQSLKSKDQSCGYDSCNAVKSGMLNVHLVPHTHDDVGWLKTVDQYYYGSKRTITKMGVQYILDSVVSHLLGNPQRRFIYVEVAFFKRWWDEQTDAVKDSVKMLVNQGRLEFILGGWSMNDEAATHYNAIIDQHTLGLQFLSSTFGECGRPRVAWQIDPFGHSREMASIFARMGYDGLFFGRIDYEDKAKRELEKGMEMVWLASPNNLGEAASLFTGTLFNGYGPPPGFCFDAYCTDEPIMDDPRLHDYNVNKRVDDFLTQVNIQRGSYRSNHLIMTMGEDFNYVDADMWYKNLDKLIKYVNQRQSNGSKVNLLYSTPSCYLHQLYLSNLTWPTKIDDFFPYAHRPHSYWTGYFTSRPTHKRFSRYSNNVLQAVKQLSVLAQIKSPPLLSNIQTFREAMGVVQHHDAITGTAKQAVANDYALRLTHGLRKGEEVVTAAYNSLLAISPKAQPLDIHHCDLLNISQCCVSGSSEKFVVLVYNPLAHPIQTYIRLPVSTVKYDVLNATGQSIPYQINSVAPWIKSIPERKATSTNDIVFIANLPALGFTTFFITQTTQRRRFMNEWSGIRENEDIVLSNEFLSLTYDGSTHKLKYLHSTLTNTTHTITMEFGYYIGMPGLNILPKYQASGAYVFRPLHENADMFDKPKIVKVIRGGLGDEVWTEYSTWVHSVTRLYRGWKHVEIEWTVGPIPIMAVNSTSPEGKEIVVRYIMKDLKSQQLFYTDANGREILTRKRNYRPTWNLTDSEPISANYFPVNSRIFIKDVKADLQLTILTDRSQGGSSLNDGHIELMLHRRLLYDDGLGVDEALNESGSDGKGLIATGKHMLLVGNMNDSTDIHRQLALHTYMAPVVSMVDDMSHKDWTTQYRTQWTGLVHPSLPPNVHLLTLEWWGERGCLVRLEHFYERGESGEMSQPVTVNLQEIFHPFRVISLVELSLGANQNLSDMHRFKWRTEHPTKSDMSHTLEQPLTNFTVSLSPMQIRTFLFNIQ